jgi:hypothetical protein
MKICHHQKFDEGTSNSNVHEIFVMTGILKITLHENNSDLNLCEMSACWVLRMHTEEHKIKRTDASLENL